MKTNYILAIATTLLSVNLQAAEQKKDVPGATARPKSYFYTGKPYDQDLDSYMFTFRSYNPRLNRWTSADPSGFPDGANNRIYAPVPISQIDPSGLLTISVTTPNPLSDDVTINGVNHVVTANTITPVNATNISFGGWDIEPGGNIAGTLNVNSYGALSNNVYGNDPNSLGVQLNIGSVSGLPALANNTTYGWLQVVTTNDSSGNRGNSVTFIDNAKSTSTPLYNQAGGNAGGGPDPYFYDWSSRNAGDPSRIGQPVTWQASLYLVSVLGNSVTVYNGFSWGWTLE